MNNLHDYQLIPGSFRDPDGFLYWADGVLYRQINGGYQANYDYLMSSGLYENLTKDGLLIRHEEVDIEPARPDTYYRIIKPEPVPFISYPYEWCFSQLKDAALLSLNILKRALDFGMVLKDGSVYNIQFFRGKPIFIDTLSFEKYREGEPWIAYKQFCQHFLAPLALMSYNDTRLNQLFRIYIDGFPLDLASSLLPGRTRFTFSLLSHIHLHAGSQKHYAAQASSLPNNRKMPRLSLLGLVDNLESAVNNLKWRPPNTEWADYYTDTNYSQEAFEHKKRAVAQFIDRIKPKSVWDFGANTGVFSRIASNREIDTIAFDIDPAAVETNYLDTIAKKETSLLPLLLDVTNPSPGIGWENKERISLLERGPADLALALALIHHLAISNNVPVPKIAEFFFKICKVLIIEFVPKTDSQVTRLLATRKDIFDSYTQSSFEAGFGEFFAIQSAVKITGSERVLYLMERKNQQQ